MTSLRVDQACHDPLTLWALILEDEEAGNAAELGEVAEYLYVDAAAARSETARLRAEVHTLTGLLHHPG